MERLPALYDVTSIWIRICVFVWSDYSLSKASNYINEV